MAQRQAGEFHTDVGIRAGDAEAGQAAAGLDARFARVLQGDPARAGIDDVAEQRAHVAAGVGGIERGDQRQRRLQALQVGGELGFEFGIEHVGLQEWASDGSENG